MLGSFPIWGLGDFGFYGAQWDKWSYEWRNQKICRHIGPAVSGLIKEQVSSFYHKVDRLFDNIFLCSIVVFWIQTVLAVHRWSRSIKSSA